MSEVANLVRNPQDRLSSGSEDWPISRTAALKASIEARMDAGIRKTTFYPLIAESLEKTQDQPKQIRRALAFERLLDTVVQEVHPYELLGGSISGMWPLDPHQPSYTEQYAKAKAAIEEKLNPRPDSHLAEAGALPGMYIKRPEGMPARFALMARDHYDASCDYRRLQDIIKELQQEYAGSDKISAPDIASYMEAWFTYDYGKAMDLFYELPWYAANHIGLNYGRLINSGYLAILTDIETRLALESDPEKKEFYTAAGIAIKAVIRYIRRYAQTYLAAAAAETDPVRSSELKAISRTLNKIAENKAESFIEAMQLVWISHVIANTQLGCALSFSRFDQYMFPFYDRDIKNGSITNETVRDYLCCLMLKVNEPKMRTVQSLALGGTTIDGKDACNELTRQVLIASRSVRLPYPNISLRVAEKLTPAWALDEAVETIKCGFGSPMLINDDVWIKNFMTLGHKAEYARDYYNMGCVEMLVQNKQAGWYYFTHKSFLSYPGLLKEVLDSCKGGKRRFDAFGELLDALKERVRGEVAEYRVSPDYQFLQSPGLDPFGSCLVDGCLENGRDMCRGGAEIQAHIAVSGQGLATAVDSLAAIKTLVYDQKKLSLEELIAAVENNFKDQESLRQYILNNVPHYGNDIDWVDNIAVELFNFCTEEVFHLNDGSIPQKYVNSYFSYTSHVSIGEVTPATPDGRLATVALSDNLGPSQGRDTEGPTKLMNTLLKFNYQYLNGANACNLKVSPNLFVSAGGTRALKYLLLSFLHGGGPQVQVNFVRREDLLDARLNPMKHRDIVVRIAGFCEYFIYLDAKQQEEVIARTEHTA